MKNFFKFLIITLYLVSTTCFFFYFDKIYSFDIVKTVFNHSFFSFYASMAIGIAAILITFKEKKFNFIPLIVLTSFSHFALMKYNFTIGQKHALFIIILINFLIFRYFFRYFKHYVNIGASFFFLSLSFLFFYFFSEFLSNKIFYFFINLLKFKGDLEPSDFYFALTAGFFTLIFISIVILINKTQYILFSIFYINAVLCIYYSLYIINLLPGEIKEITTLQNAGFILGMFNIFLSVLYYEKGGIKLKSKKKSDSLSVIEKLKRKKEKIFVVSPEVFLHNPFFIKEVPNNLTFYVSVKIKDDIKEITTKENTLNINKAFDFISSYKEKNFKMSMGASSGLPDGINFNSIEGRIFGVFVRLKNEHYNPVIITADNDLYTLASENGFDVIKLDDFLLKAS